MPLAHDRSLESKGYFSNPKKKKNHSTRKESRFLISKLRTQYLAYISVTVKFFLGKKYILHGFVY